MVCPCKRTSLAAQRRKKRRPATTTRRRKRTARQVSAYDIKTGGTMNTAMAGRVSAYKLDGSRMPANTYGAFSFSPYTPQVVTPVVAVTPSALTSVAAAATFAAAQRRKRRRTRVRRARR